MNVTNTFIMVRFALSALLAVGGITCIVFGYRLFRDGTGIAKAIDKFDWKSEQIKISAAGMSVGSVLMLTSVGWGYFASSSIPKMELAAGDTKITQSPALIQKMDWANAIGSNVETKDKQPVGTITGVLVGDKPGISNYVVSTKDSAHVTLGSYQFRFDKPGSATVNLSKRELEALFNPSTIRNPGNDAKPQR